MPPLLTLQEAAALCASSDTGDDHELSRKVAVLLYSLKAGGLLVTVMQDGREFVDAASIRAVTDRLISAGIFGEGMRLWSGFVPESLDRPLTTPELKLALIGTAGHVVNKKGLSIAWADFIRLEKFREAAHAGNQGKYDLWRLSDARNFAESWAYVFEHAMSRLAPASNRQMLAETDAFGAMAAVLKKR